MLDNSNTLTVSRREFLTTASGVAVTSSLAGRNTQAPPSGSSPHPTIYTVTVDVTTNPISYTVVQDSSTAGKKKANRLKANAGETVRWQANTKSPQYHLAIFFIKETPLVDSNKNPVYAIHGSEKEAAAGKIGGDIDTEASEHYEYYVAVFDGAATYTDDPKIIVGSGGRDATAYVRTAVDDLRLADAQLSRQPEAQQQIKSIEQQLLHLANTLK